MSSLQQKIRRHANQQKSMTHTSGGKTGSRNPQETPNVRLRRQGIKVVITTMLRELKETILQKLNHKFCNFYKVRNPSEFAHT